MKINELRNLNDIQRVEKRGIYKIVQRKDLD